MVFENGIVGHNDDSIRQNGRANRLKVLTRPRLVYRGIISCMAPLAHGDSEPNVPVFGSAMASLQFLDKVHSTVRPQKTLGQEGAIDGVMTKDGKTNKLVVIVRDDDMPNEIWIQGSDKPALKFVAAYDSFLLYLLDIDGDGANKFFFECGSGQETFVYERRLSVYRVVRDRFESIFNEAINGYSWDERAKESDGWARRYRLVGNLNSGHIDIILH